MTYYVLSQTPESGVRETWTWLTDVITAESGKEQRISLSALPKRALEQTLGFDTEAQIRAQQGFMYANFARPIVVPFFHLSAKLKQTAVVGTKLLKFNPVRTDLRAGSLALVRDKGGFQVVTIDQMAADGATIVETLTRSFNRGNFVAPLTEMYNAADATMSRARTNNSASLKLSLAETKFLAPFVNPAIGVGLTMLAGFPVLDRPQLGDDQFEDTLVDGMTVLDYGGVVSTRALWTHSDWTFSRAFLAQRIMIPDDWRYWYVFGEYAKGSANPFFVPTWRNDLPPLNPIGAGDGYFRTTNTDYLSKFYPSKVYRQIAIVSSAGTHFARVTGSVVDGAYVGVGFDPPLPAGAGWQSEQRVAFLLKCRIADDTISCQHDSMQTTVSLNLRTVDE